MRLPLINVTTKRGESERASNGIKGNVSPVISSREERKEMENNAKTRGVAGRREETRVKPQDDEENGKNGKARSHDFS